MRTRALPQSLHRVNEGLAFLLELAALAALAWWGAGTGVDLGLRIALAIAAPGVAAVLWGMFAAPRATVRLPMTGVLAVKAITFAAAAIYARAQHVLAVIFAGLALVSTTLAAVDRDAAMRTHEVPGPSGGSQPA